MANEYEEIFTRMVESIDEAPNTPSNLFKQFKHIAGCHRPHRLIMKPYFAALVLRKTFPYPDEKA